MSEIPHAASAEQALEPSSSSPQPTRFHSMSSAVEDPSAGRPVQAPSHAPRSSTASAPISVRGPSPSSPRPVTARRRCSPSGPLATTGDSPGSRSTGATTTRSCCCGTSRRRSTALAPIDGRALNALAVSRSLPFWSTVVPRLASRARRRREVRARLRRRARALRADSIEILSRARRARLRRAPQSSSRAGPSCPLAAAAPDARQPARARDARSRADAPRGRAAPALGGRRAPDEACDDSVDRTEGWAGRCSSRRSRRGAPAGAAQETGRAEVRSPATTRT